MDDDIRYEEECRRSAGLDSCAPAEQLRRFLPYWYLRPKLIVAGSRSEWLCERYDELTPDIKVMLQAGLRYRGFT